MTTAEILGRARAAKGQIALLSTDEKNKILNAMADSLIEHTDEILSANNVDIVNAKETVSEVMLDRLTLTAERIQGMAEGLREVALLPDPVGRIISENSRRGMQIKKVSVPIGTVAIIYESRPNVTSDAAAL